MQTPSPPPRWHILDAGRAAAVLAMVVYHLCWDLDYYGLADLGMFRDPVPIWSARLIAGSFLFLAGFNHVLSLRQGFDLKGLGKRLAMVGGCAAAISAGSYVMFPESWIFFGILHGIALGSVLVLAFDRLPTAVVALSALFFLGLPSFYTDPLFNGRGLAWIGLASRGPITNDFVPVFPWFGVILAGLVAARLALARDLRPAWAPAGRFGRAALWVGRHSLVIYMLHQPIMLAALYPIATSP